MDPISSVDLTYYPNTLHKHDAAGSLINNFMSRWLSDRGWGMQGGMEGGWGGRGNKSVKCKEKGGKKL